MATVTRSINPLHFEDLEPKRFEDLVRQLAYDFRQWRSIEALGRTGADEGMDIRAFEIPRTVDANEEGEEEDSIPEANTTPDRQWIIQCKRHKEFGPKDAKNAIKDAIPEGSAAIHGFVLAVACDVSKKTRDSFREECSKRGVQEVYVWAKGELEDMLLQPKNDRLLFTHFGISLHINRRNARTKARSYLALKKRLVDQFGLPNQRKPHQVALIRDPQDEEYPGIASLPDFLKKPKWMHLEFYSHDPVNHVAFMTHKYFAYLSDDHKKWDALLDCNGAAPAQPPTYGIPKSAWFDQKVWSRYWKFWMTLPPRNRAWAIGIRVIPYDRIIVLDTIGDIYNPGLQLLVERKPDGRLFEPGKVVGIELDEMGGYWLAASDANRIEFFPKVIPEGPPSSPSSPKGI